MDTRKVSCRIPEEVYLQLLDRAAKQSQKNRRVVSLGEVLARILIRSVTAPTPDAVGR